MKSEAEKPFVVENKAFGKIRFYFVFGKIKMGNIYRAYVPDVILSVGLVSALQSSQ